jgi:hypothetical protein
MVNFKTILPRNLFLYVREAFCEDEALINKYHVVNGSLDDCVDDTVRRIYEIYEKEPLKFMGVYENMQPIGFSVIGKNFLLSFGINIHYRTKENVLDWWTKICQMLNNEFATWIFKKNTRTVEFLKRNGMMIVEATSDKEFYNLVYITNTEISCPPADLSQQE